MPVPTTSTLPTVKAQLVTLLTAALATTGEGGTQLPVSYAWPGPTSAAEAVFLGRHPDLVANPLQGTNLDSRIPNSKAGRKQRTEKYAVEVTVWSFRPDLTAADAATAEARAFVIAGKVEDVLADNAQLGIAGIEKAELSEWEIALLPFEKGWVAHLVLSIEVTARLS